MSCVCDAGFTGPDGGPCVACVTGKYKVSNGSAACAGCVAGQYQPESAAISASSCITCAADTFSNATATVCTACPTGFKALPGASTVQDCCNSNSMPTWPKVSNVIASYSTTACARFLALALKPLPAAAFTDLTASCGVNSNQKCGCTGSDVGTLLTTKTCDKAFDDIKTDASSFVAIANQCPAGQRETTWNFNYDCSISWGMSRTGEQPYITIDFQRTVDVTAVKIYSYYNVVRELRPKIFDIFIGESTTISSNTACATNQNFPSNSWDIFSSFGCVGRGLYLSVRQSLFLGNYMQIAEMEVVGSVPEQLVASFASISTRNNAAVGTIPTYNAAGGPNGKGHVSFDRTKSQYLDAGTRTLNIATNGGFTIVTVVRFTGSGANLERIVDLGSGGGVNNIIIMRENGNNVQVMAWNGGTYPILSSGGVIVQNS